MNKKKQLAKNTMIIFLGKVCTQLISFFLLPLYTSFLAKQELGLVDLIQTYITLLVPIITLELEMSIFRFLIDSREKEVEKTTLISNSFFILLISLTIFTTLYIITTMFITIPFRWLVLFCIIVCVLSGNFLQVARGVGKIVDYSISVILTGITTIISNIILICFLHKGAEGMIISMALANFVCSMYLFIRLKLYSKIHFKMVNLSLIKEMYKYSLPLIPNSISWWIVNVSDRTIISYVLGTAFNGLYAISNKFPTIISSLTGIFNLSWSESASLHINSSDKDIFFSDVFNTIMKLFTSLGIGMLACMPLVFPILINTKYYQAYIYIPFLVLATVFNVALCLYNQIYLAKKLSKEVALTAVFGALINIIINIVFIKYIGLYAAALSTTIAYFIMMIYRHIDIKKYINIKLEENFILKSILMFIFIITVYYQKNVLIHIIGLIIVCIYAYLDNKKTITSSYKTLKKKIFSK